MGQSNRKRDPNPKPGTCQWCGHKLPRPRKVEWAHSAQPPRTHDRGWGLDGDCQGTLDLSKPEETPSGCKWECSEGHWVYGVRKKVKAEPYYEKGGGYGDGYFCGLRCGYDYAVTWMQAREGARGVCAVAAPRKA